MVRVNLGGEQGSAVVDFVFGSFALLAIFGSALTIVVNLYLRTVLTNAATDAARLMSRADVTAGCNDQSTASTAAAEQARRTVQALVGDKLTTATIANTERAEGLCTTVVKVQANLPGLPLLPNFTQFEATAHATVELQG